MSFCITVCTSHEIQAHLRHEAVSRTSKLGTTKCFCCTDGVHALTADRAWCSSSTGNNKTVGLYQSILE